MICGCSIVVLCVGCCAQTCTRVLIRLCLQFGNMPKAYKSIVSSPVSASSPGSSSNVSNASAGTPSADVKICKAGGEADGAPKSKKINDAK